MKLAEWCDKSGRKRTEPTTETGAVSVFSTENDEVHRDLWHLEDYYVSSVSGAVVWLMPSGERFVRFLTVKVTGYAIDLTDSEIREALELARLTVSDGRLRRVEAEVMGVSKL